MGMGFAEFAPTWLRQVSPPPMLHMTTLTTATTDWLQARVLIFRCLYGQAPP